MHALRALLGVALTLALCGCQLGYYMHSAYHQTLLVQNRESIDKVLRKSSTTPEEKRKLELVKDVKAFTELDLGLRSTQNYTTYVKLDDPYVTWVVQAAQAFELKPYLWHFPLVGDVPYKGYFVKSMALEEAQKFPKDQYDTYVRGVSAYSTLGWFQDSVLSSMLRYEDYELVEVLIHETVHTTLYIKSNADFNERMAQFLGVEGMKIFYRKRDGENSSALKKAEEDSHDQKLFSQFITKELEDLKTWYVDNKGKVTAESKASRLKEIQAHFVKDWKPKMQTDNYREFEKRELNNALLLAYKTYEFSLDDYQKLFDHFDRDFKKTLDWLKGLENEPHPDQTLKAFVSSLPAK